MTIIITYYLLCIESELRSYETSNYDFANFFPHGDLLPWNLASLSVLARNALRVLSPRRFENREGAEKERNVTKKWDFETWSSFKGNLILSFENQENPGVNMILVYGGTLIHPYNNEFEIHSSLISLIKLSFNSLWMYVCPFGSPEKVCARFWIHTIIHPSRYTQHVMFWLLLSVCNYSDSQAWVLGSRKHLQLTAGRGKDGTTYPLMEKDFERERMRRRRRRRRRFDWIGKCYSCNWKNRFLILESEKVSEREKNWNKAGKWRKTN